MRTYTKATKNFGIGSIDPGIFNDPGATANAAVPAGFARFSAAERFISNADLNKKAPSVTPREWKIDQPLNFQPRREMSSFELTLPNF